MTRGIVIVIGIAAAGLLAACLDREPATEPPIDRSAALRAENARLRSRASALRSENTRLAAQLGGPARWTNSQPLARVGRLRGTVPYLRLCPAEQVLVGLRGTAGALIDSLVGVCAPVDAGQDAVSDASTELDPVGGGAGSAFARVCPAGSAVVGVNGRAGDAIDAIELVCAPASRDAGADETTITALEPIGGPAGAPFERRCPSGRPAVGISGAYLEQVESLSLHCAPTTPSVTAPAPDPPSETVTPDATGEEAE